MKGLEPSTPGATVQCSNQLSYTHHDSNATGAPEGTRTPDLRLRRPLLYPPELLALKKCAGRSMQAAENEKPGFELPAAHCSLPTEIWSGRADLNGRPPAPKAGALPGCATPRQAQATSFYTCTGLNQGFDPREKSDGSASLSFRSALPRWLTRPLAAGLISASVFPRDG